MPIPTQHAIAQRLPDIPRWVETRGALLWGECEIFGLEESPQLSVVVRDVANNDVFVVGTPSLDAVRAAVDRNPQGGEVIAPWDQAARLSEALPGRTGERAILHLLKDPRSLPTARFDHVAFLDPTLLDTLSIDDELLGELRSAATHAQIAAAFVGGMPVSFCYAGWVTETLWDISIDTLPDYQRQGHAAGCVAFMIRHFRNEGKEPVWGSLEGNPASWQLARKLGFEPVDELVLFEL